MKGGGAQILMAHCDHRYAVGFSPQPPRGHTSPFYLAKKFSGGNRSKAGLMGRPKGVGMRQGFGPSRAKRRKLKHSFILGFTKSHLSNT